MRVVVGISGGVDSAAAAALLVRKGFEVTGVYLRLHKENKGEDRAGHIAEILGIRFLTVSAEKIFNENVLLPFFQAYGRGETPNPCVLCNEKVKFATLFSVSDSLGGGFVASGHYAGIRNVPAGPLLVKALDREKDQSYMLYRVPAGMLSRIVFPLGGMTKSEVREMASTVFPGVFDDIPESSDICFIPEGDLPGIVEARTGPFEPGNIIAVTGEILGRHRGINMFTIGQRKGLSLPNGPWFVVGKKIDTHDLIVGRKDDLVVGKVFCSHPVWHLEPKPGSQLEACRRYRCRADRCVISGITKTSFVCSFPGGTSGIAPGQSLVLYSNDTVFGGGIIEKAEKGGPTQNEE